MIVRLDRVGQIAALTASRGTDNRRFGVARRL
jgi:hypothetical protein